MATKFLHNIDLDQNQLLNPVIHNATTATRPTSPVEGQIYYDTVDKVTYVWDGAAWVSNDTNAVTSIVATDPINIVRTGDEVAISVDDATTLAKGVVQVGTNIDVLAGTISVKDSSTTQKGVIQLGGDLSGSSTSQTVNSVGGSTAANIADAVSKRHTQGTDTGTTSQTFQVDSDASGPVLKNVNGELQVRNAGDTTFAPVRVGDMYVEGTLTSINSNEVNIGDSTIELNSDVKTAAENSSGGVEVRRVLADQSGAGTISSSGTTVTGVGTSFGTEVVVGDVLVFGAQRRRVIGVASPTSLTLETAFSPEPSGDTYNYAKQANAAITFDNSSGLWKVTDGVTGDLQTNPIARKVTAVIGDGSTKDFAISHNLNTRDANVTLRQTNSPYAMVMTDIEYTNMDQITVKFKKAPTNNQYTVVVIG